MGCKRSYHSDASRTAMIGEHWTLYRLIVDVPAEHLNLFLNKSIIGFEFLVPCCEGNFCCLNFPLQYSPYSVVYDPTAFMACKLVIVAWLKAYGATTKPRAPCGTAATCDAARHALVSRLLTKYLYQVTPPYRFVLKIFSLEMFRWSNRKSTTGDAEVFSQGTQEMVWRKKV